MSKPFSKVPKAGHRDPDSGLDWLQKSDGKWTRIATSREPLADTPLEEAQKAAIPVSRADFEALEKRVALIEAVTGATQFRAVPNDEFDFG